MKTKNTCEGKTHFFQVWEALRAQVSKFKVTLVFVISPFGFGTLIANSLFSLCVDFHKNAAMICQGYVLYQMSNSALPSITFLLRPYEIPHLDKRKSSSLLSWHHHHHRHSGGVEPRSWFPICESSHDHIRPHKSYHRLLERGGLSFGDDNNNDTHKDKYRRKLWRRKCSCIKV